MKPNPPTAGTAITPQPAGARRRVVIAGGSGFIGQILSAHLAARGDDVVVLTRRPESRNGAREEFWDGRSLGPWTERLDGATALINLAGRSVNCRYHDRNRRQMIESRVVSTQVLGEAIARCKAPPRVWLNASTATIYLHTEGAPHDEVTGKIGATPEAKDAFSIQVAVEWERAFEAARTPRTRKIALRSAMVLGNGGNSVLPALRRLVRLGLGGTMGHGRQFISWIHEEDFCRTIDWLLEHEELHGIVNIAAPNPLPNAEAMRILRETEGVPFGLPATRWMLEVGAVMLRTETELILKSRRVVPGRLLASGFQVRFPDFRRAVEDLHCAGATGTRRASAAASND